MANKDLALAVNILTLVNGLEPIAIQYIQRLLENLQGKSVEEITAEADSIWADVIAKAKAELNQG